MGHLVSGQPFLPGVICDAKVGRDSIDKGNSVHVAFLADHKSCSSRTIWSVTDCPRMPRWGMRQPSSEYNRAFCAAVKELHERKDLTQLHVATALGTTVENYRKYEKRTPLPHRYISILCLLFGIPESELFGMVNRALAGPKRRSAKVA